MATATTCCEHSCHCTHQYCAQKVSIFSSLSSDELKQITDLITHKTFSKGQVIFSEGDPFNQLYIINSGSIKVFKYTKDGKEQILYILNEGEFLGDLSLLKKGVLQFNAVALEDVKLCIIYKSDFDNIIKNNPTISLKVLEYAYDRITELENLVQTLTTKDIESRLATLLINLSKNFGTKTNKGIDIHLPMSREDMANFIGVTRETISRKLSYFQSESIIEIIGNKTIRIISLDELQNFTE